MSLPPPALSVASHTADFHSTESFKEIPVISCEQPSPHIEKENKRVEHDVGHSGPGWKENSEIQLTQLCLIHICWAAEEKKRGEVFGGFFLI